MRLGLQNVSYVACLKIHRPGTSTRGEDSHASFAADVVCHSSAFGCQCSSRNPPGFSFTIAVAIGVTGKFFESMIFTSPPAVTLLGFIWLVLKAKDRGATPVPSDA